MTPFELDMALQEPVLSMVLRGVLVDTEAREKLLEEHSREWAQNQEALNDLAGFPINVNSPVAVRDLLYNYLKLPSRTRDLKLTTSEPAIRSLMAFAEQKLSEVSRSDAVNHWSRCVTILKLIIAIRAIRKRVSSYLTFPLDYDERARCLMAVGGTETMRFSHSKTSWGTGLNLATVPHSVRSIFVADPGYELGEFDLNRGESWVYSFLSMDPELIRIHTSGGDFHSETAAAIQTAFGGKNLTAEDIARLAKNGDPFGYRIRYLGKRVNHASAYRMGPFKAAEVVNEESDETGIVVTPAQMLKAQNLWKHKYQGISRWWRDIDEQLIRTRTLRTPYGRVRQFFGYMSDHLKKEATAYVPQSTSVDYLNRGMLRVFRKLVKADKLQLLHQNHDSILVQWKEELRDEIVPEIVVLLESELVINGEKFVIPVEAKYGRNWGDYHPTKNPGGLRGWKED